MTLQVSPQRSVATSSLYILIQGVVGNVIGLVYISFATRILSVAEIGIATALSLIASVFVVFGSLAIPSAAMKYIPEFFGRGEGDVSKGIYRRVLGFGLLVSGLSSFLCLIAATAISAIFLGSQSYEPLVRVLALDVFALLLSSFCGGILAGIKKFKEISLAGIALAILRYTSSIYLLLIGYGLMGAVVGWVIGDFIGLGLMVFFASTTFRAIHVHKTYPFSQLLKYSLPLYASGILSFFSGTIDRFVILLFSGLQTFAIYSVAMTTTSAIGMVSSSLSGPLTPQYSEIYGQHGKEALKESSMITSRYIFLIYVPLAVGLAATALPTITLFYGFNYESGWLPLALVSIAAALTCASFVVSNLLLSLSLTRAFLESSVLAMVIGVPLLALLVGSFGSAGAALAKSLMFLVLFAYQAYILKKSFGLYFDLSAFENVLVSSAVMAIVVVLMQFIWRNIYMLPLYILVGGFIYFLMLRILKVFNKQDIILFNQIAPKRFRKVVDAFAKLYGVRDYT